MREKVQSTLDITNNITIKDPTSILWSSFKWTNGYFSHKITKKEIERPYLISYAYYGIVDYWDIILLLNNISDIFEVIPESEIFIPKLVDLKTFILENKK
jgi:hypothetical protein